MNVFSQFVNQQLAQADLNQKKPASEDEGKPKLADLDQAVLSFIKSHPNKDVREIASVLGVKTPSLYSVLRRLADRRMINSAGRMGNCNIWVAA